MRIHDTKKETICAMMVLAIEAVMGSRIISDRAKDGCLRKWAVILKNNKPRYIVVDFEEYEAIKGIREARERKS